MATEYTDEFYRALREGAHKSARAIVPLVLEYVEPRSVVDVGCGTGTWLSTFREHGITDILGVDGDYIKKEGLEIPDDRFLSFDLRTPFRIDRQFDLVVSLEVAEHLPPECAGIFVETLVGLGPVILFSAAIPLQGGTHHINEQWPDYWAALFKLKDYIPVDLIRKRVWQNPDVDFWYVQNTLIFVRRGSLKRYPALRKEIENAGDILLSVVHPRMHLEMGRRLASADESCAWCSAETEKFRAEAETHRAQAGLYIAETEKFKTEAETYRVKAEFSFSEAKKFRAEAETHRAQAGLYIAEAGKHKAEAEAYKFEAEPRNMGLRKVMRALPIMVVNALKRKGRRLISRG
ncbi:MAG: methyltransferase domain-containing protein [Nitrospirae bacterium]|nr:methyltransferase domain-containing protein [Nitrospirota bacterium]